MAIDLRPAMKTVVTFITHQIPPGSTNMAYPREVHLGVIVYLILAATEGTL